MRVSRVLLVAAFAACAASPPPRPDDMSAAAHRDEAAREREAARRSLEEHGVRTKLIAQRVPGDYAGMHTVDESGPAGPVIGPRGGTPDFYAADARLAHACAHEAAALELERFEDAECAGIPAAERSACPLLLGAGAVVDVAGGVEIRFRAGAPVDEIYRRARCHFAYARAQGAGEAVSCPLYVKGVNIERTDPRVIRMTGPSEGVERLRRASREQVPSPR